jgi:hypothetical protein
VAQELALARQRRALGSVAAARRRARRLEAQQLEPLAGSRSRLEGERPLDQREASGAPRE